MLVSSACTHAQLDSPAFQDWARRLGESPGNLHRKLWEWCFICQALHERRMLMPGRRGLGFAVGREPLTSLFVSLECEVLATDLVADEAAKAGWVSTDQHADGVEHLNERNLCTPADLAARVRFQNLDMNAIPEGLGTFDFLWSACAFEHLGDLQRGIDFVRNAMCRLKPAGIAVHTTEFNCDSDDETLAAGPTVLYRRRDLLELARVLTADGHRVEPLNFELGGADVDRFVDEPPYGQGPHLKLRIGPYVCTSYGLIISAAVHRANAAGLLGRLLGRHRG
jgi:hypothetical protein